MIPYREYVGETWEQDEFEFWKDSGDLHTCFSLIMGAKVNLRS